MNNMNALYIVIVKIINELLSFSLYVTFVW